MAKVSKAFIAKYRNKCPKCGNQYKVGRDWLHYVDNIVQHVECPKDGYGALGTSVKKGHQYGINEPLPIVEDISDALVSAIETSLLEDEQPKEKSFLPSKYQQTIFDFIVTGTGHAVVEAVAGSGKTTTIVNALDLTPKDARVGFVAFNKHIASELKKRAPDHVHVSTLHSLGLSILRKLNDKIQVDDDKVGTILDEFYPV